MDGGSPKDMKPKPRGRWRKDGISLFFCAQKLNIFSPDGFCVLLKNQNTGGKTLWKWKL